MTDDKSDGPEFIAVALQVSVKGVNRCKDRESSRARIDENLKRIGEYTTRRRELPEVLLRRAGAARRRCPSTR